MKLKTSGLAESTIKHVSYRLEVLNKHCDLNNPTEVARYIASMKVSNAYKDTFVKNYDYYVL